MVECEGIQGGREGVGCLYSDLITPSNVMSSLCLSEILCMRFLGWFAIFCEEKPVYVCIYTYILLCDINVLEILNLTILCLIYAVSCVEIAPATTTTWLLDSPCSWGCLV